LAVQRKGDDAGGITADASFWFTLLNNVLQEKMKQGANL